MTVDELKRLRLGEIVRCLNLRELGEVVSNDTRAVEIYWPDDTSSLIWFAHAIDGRDTRHLWMEQVPDPNAKPKECKRADALKKDG